ncbi:MAG: VWA domain-containing protein, partial [Deltaproteobacteria bacterium]
LEGTVFRDQVKDKLARLHLHMCEVHPQKRMISPRDLIDVIAMLRENGAADEKSVYTAVSVNYLEGLLEPEEIKTAEQAVRDVFPDFSRPDYSDVSFSRHGVSNLDAGEIEHLRASTTMMSKAAALEKILSTTGRQVLICEERGGMGVELVKLLCSLTGRDLDIFEGHPFVTAKMLLSGESFKFNGEFEAAGRRTASGEFGVTRGGIGRYMVREDKLALVPPEKRKPVIIAIPNVDSIPTAELVKLNELVTTRSAPMQDDDGKLATFVLPDWVTIVPITSEMDSLSSPFANRFRKVGLPFLRSSEEWHEVLTRLYPDISGQETALLYDIARRASEACRQDRFEIGYEFCPRDLFELALRVQMFKQNDGASAQNANPAWYAFKAVYYVYLRAMAPEDRAKFIDEVLAPALSAKAAQDVPAAQVRAYCRFLLDEIAKVSRDIVTEDFTVDIPEGKLTGQFYYLDNGIAVSIKDGKLNVVTSHVYSVDMENVPRAGDEPYPLSDGIGVSRNGKGIRLTLKLLSKVGGIPLNNGPENKRYSVPIGEAGSDEYLHLADPLKDALIALFQAQTPVKAANGKYVMPRMILMPGETGTGKTTIPKWIGRVAGIPLVRINPHKKMHGSEMTFSYSLGETIELDISEFLLACGKVNGRRIVSGMPTSDRLIIFIDEANITRDVWYLLDAIARGETSFRVETPAGEAVTVELDRQICVILNYNPPEHYGGTGKHGNRYLFPEGVQARSVKVYVDEPLATYTGKEMQAILEGIYSRGEAYAERQELLEGTKPPARAGGFTAVKPEPFHVGSLGLPGQQPLDSLKEDIVRQNVPSQDDGKGGPKKKALSADEIAKRKEEFLKRHSFDPAALDNALAETASFFATEKKTSLRYLYLSAKVLRPLFTGLALGAVPSKSMEKALVLCAQVSGKLPDIIQSFTKEIASETVSRRRIEILLGQLDNASQELDVFLEHMGVEVLGGKPFIAFAPCAIAGRKDIDRGRLKALLGGDYAKIFADDMVPSGLVLGRVSQDGIVGYKTGKFVVITFVGDEKQEDDIFFHEFGHLTTNRLAKFDRRFRERLHKNIELYSVFFPLIFSADPAGYLQGDLRADLGRISAERARDAYALAAKAALNAFAVDLNLDRIDNFEPDRIERIISEVSKYEPERIREMAVKLFRDPEKYFKDVEAGVYYAKTLTANIGGVSMAFSYAQTTEDDIVRPRVEYQEIEGADQGEAEEKPDNSGFLDDRERGSGKEAELPGSSAFWEKKYRELFAPDIDDSSEVVFVPTGGPDINPEAVAGNDSSRLFVLPAYEDETKGLAQNIFFIVDVSGSIQGDYEQQQLLEEIISRHSAFLLSLSKSNPDLNIAIGAISSKMDILFDFRAWKNAGTQDAKRRLLKKALADMWHVGNGSGIETGSILDTLSKTDFPRASGKDTKNLVVVYTDGEETGPRGESLRKKIEEFSDGRRREGGSKRGGRIDFVFMGGNLGNYGQALRDSYPAWLHLEGSDITPDTFLEALCKISYLQTRNKLEGDLSRISFKGGAKDGGQQDIGLLIEDMKNSSVNDTKYQRALRLFRIDVRDRPGSKITREQMDGLFTVLKKSDPNGPVSRMELLEIIGALLGRDIGFQVTKEQAGILLESFMEEGLVRRVWGDTVGAALISNPALLEIVISAIKETYSTAVRSDLSFSVSMALAAGLKLSQEQLDILFGLFNPGEDQGSYHREFSCLLACALRNDRTLKVQPGNMDLLLAALFIDFYNSDGVEKAIGEAASTDPGLMEQVFKALNNAGSEYRRINLLSAIHTALENHKDLKLSAAQHDSLTALLDGQKDQYFNGKVGKTLSQALINDPAFVERVFDILDKAEPGTRRNELIQVLVRVSDKLQYAHRFITPTQQTDRTLILNSIPDPLLDPFFSQTDGKAYADIMLPVDKTEATVAAMGLKKAIYRRYIKKELGSDPGEQAIDPMKEGFALLVALYKMPWDKFMAKMNACGGYAKVHADPLLLRSKAAADGGESWRDKKFAGILDIYLESEAEESAYAWRLGQMLKDEPGLLEDFFTVHFGKADSDIARGRLANVVKELYRLDFMQKSELARLKPAQVNVLVSALAQVESDSARSALSESIGKSLENNPQLLDGILDRIAEPSLTEPLASVVAGVLRRNRSLILSAVRFDGILELAIAAENGLYGAGRGLENILSEAIINDPGSLINHVFSLLRKGDQQTQACLAKALADTVQPIRQRVHLSSVEVNTLLNVALDQPPFFIRKEDWDSGKLVEALKTAMLSQTIQTNAFGAIAGALAGDPELSLSGGQVDTLLLVFDKENEYSAVRRAIVDVLSASLINRPSALGAIMAHIKANKSDDGRAGLVWAVRKALVGSFSLRLSPEYLNDLIDLMGETKSDRALEAFSETIRIAKREAPFGLTPARADIVFDCFGRTASDEAGENLCGILLNAFFNELFVYTVTPDRIEKFFAWFVRTRSDKAKETAAALIRQVLSKTDGRLTHSQTGSLIDALFAAQSSSEMGLFRDCIEWAVEKDPALIGAVLKRLDMQGLGRSFLLGACRNLVAGLAIKLSPEQLEVFVGCLSSLRAANNKADAGLAQQIISDALNANPVLLVDIVERLNQPGSAAVRNDLVAAVQLAATRMMFRGYTSSHMMTSSKDRDDPDGLAGVHYPHQYFTAPRQTDWSIMFSSIPADICGKVFLPQGGADYLSIMLDTEKARSTVNAMRLKQNAYREYIGKMNGKDPGEQPIDPKKPGFALLVALYKMPWDKFLAKMEAAGGYAAVHQDYTRLSPKIAKDGGMEDASDLDSVLDTFNGSFNPGLASKILSVLKGNDRLRVSAAQVDKIFKIFTFFFEKDRGYPGYQE